MQQGILTHRRNAGLDALVELQRVEARTFIAQCRTLTDLDELFDLDEQTAGVPQFLVMEVAGSCRLGQQASAIRLLEAERVLSGLPLLADAMDDGAFFLPQLRIVLAETRSVDLDVLRRLDVVLADRGVTLASTDLRRLVRRTVLELESPDDAADRLEKARAGRRVTFRPEQDGMGVVSALLTAEQMRQFQVGLDRLERRERESDLAAGIDRSADQRRADLFTTLPVQALTGADAAGPLGVVFNVHVPVATVLERGRQPGHVDGYGEISAEHVQLLLPHASLRPVYVDAETGQPLKVSDESVPAAGDVEAARQRVLAMLRPTVASDVTEPQHDPSAGLARLVDARDRRCAGVGCSSTRCDRDHLVPYPEGPTAVGNLGLKSRRCHRAKQHGWTMVRHPDGSVTWTSPLGRLYERPSPHVPPAAPQPRRRSPQPQTDRSASDGDDPPPF